MTVLKLKCMFNFPSLSGYPYLRIEIKYLVCATFLFNRDLVKHHISMPGDLAFDWMSSNLYWIDSSRQTAEVISTVSLKRITLIRDLLEPVALAISPSQGYD